MLSGVSLTQGGGSRVKALFVNGESLCVSSQLNVLCWFPDYSTTLANIYVICNDSFFIQLQYESLLFMYIFYHLKAIVHRQKLPKIVSFRYFAVVSSSFVTLFQLN